MTKALYGIIMGDNTIFLTTHFYPSSPRLSAQPQGSWGHEDFALLRVSGSKQYTVPRWKRAILHPIRAPLHGGYLLWIWTKNKALAAILFGQTPAGCRKQCSQRPFFAWGGWSPLGFWWWTSTVGLGYPEEWFTAGDSFCNVPVLRDLPLLASTSLANAPHTQRPDGNCLKKDWSSKFEA